MSYTCYQCGKPGHFKEKCPDLYLSLPVYDSPVFPPPPPPRIQPDPPSLSYLEAKSQLEMNTSRYAAVLLSVKCPWCEAGPWQHCVNRALGTMKYRAHDARYTAADLPVPGKPNVTNPEMLKVREP